MADTFTVACVQTTSVSDPAATMAAVGDQIRQARDAGADFITTPEVVSMLGPKRDDTVRSVTTAYIEAVLARSRQSVRGVGVSGGEDDV